MSKFYFDQLKSHLMATNTKRPRIKVSAYSGKALTTQEAIDLHKFEGAVKTKIADFLRSKRHKKQHNDKNNRLCNM